MNSYITLNSKKYKTSSGSWSPASVNRPVQVKMLLSGRNDVTYGPAVAKRWEGEVVAPVSPATGYGSISDLRTAYATLSALSFTDHYGDTYSIALLGSITERSKTPMWDGASNSFLVPIVLVPVT
jgi:hypothetical protein